MSQSPSLHIRPEIDTDRAQIAELLRQAFGGEDEAVLVEKLAEQGFVTLSLVAELQGAIVGQILFSRLTIDNENGRHDAIALAPLAVLPGHQRRGVGTRLMQAGLEASHKQGHKRVIVLGHPEFYRRFGFSSELAKNLICPFSGHEAFMALEWRGPEPSQLHGKLTYPAPFGVFA